MLFLKKIVGKSVLWFFPHFRYNQESSSPPEQIPNLNNFCKNARTQNSAPIGKHLPAMDNIRYNGCEEFTGKKPIVTYE